MKSPVASLFLIAGITLLAANASAQTKQRRGNTQPPSADAKTVGTVKICQGLPIPPGYIVTAYMTTSACPHGAYVIKKQDADSYSPSAANEREDSESESPVAANTKQKTGSESRVAANKNRGPASRRAVPLNRDVTPPAGTPDPASRPRRVGAAQSNTDIASLSGAETMPEPNRPTLQGMNNTETAPPPTRPTLQGITPMGPAVSTPAYTTAPEPGPEEVGEGDVIRVNTALVSVPVSVLDRQGRFIANLRREDFSVFENGVEQPIAYFEPAEKPFTVALILDTSPSTQFHLWQIKEAAIAFASQLRPQDRVLVVSFNEQVLLLTEATNDLNVVTSVISEHANTGNATRLYDAVDLVIRERLNKIKGRKAIVLFTDGVDTASYLANYQSTMREVEELDALIYPIQYDTTDYQRAMQNAGSGTVTIVTTSSNWPFGSSTSTQTVKTGPANGGAPLPGTSKEDYERANKYLHELAEKTGGRLNKANDTTELAQAFTRIAEELRRQYSLGYYPQTPAGASGERRQIKVRVKQPNLAVRARDSYMRSSSAPEQ